jgi:predicted RNA-binding Zn ribbon-like protein
MLVTLREGVSRVKMIFTHDTEVSLAEAAALVNTVDADGVDALATPAGLRGFLARHPFTGVIRGTAEETAGVRAIRTQLRRLWRVSDRDAAVPIINEILAAADARPFLTRHDDWDWHLHVTLPDAPLAQRMAAEAAMAFLELIRADDWKRLKTCAAPDCGDVLVDLSKNRSKRYCDDGNCGNRAAVAAYRARKRAR